MATISSRSDQNVAQLNSYLRGELSAVATYDIALHKLQLGDAMRPPLESCQRSHARRADRLRETIRAFGGTPSESAGAWGVFAKLVEKGAAVLGEKMAISALEEGEDHGLHDYKDDIDKLAAETKQLVVTELLPEQERTHRVLSDIKHELEH